MFRRLVFLTLTASLVPTACTVGGANTIAPDQCVAGVVPISAPTHQSWVQLKPGHSPSPRTGAAFVFDSASGAGVLFGGSTGSGYLADTWTWDGAGWNLQHPRSSPSARYDAGVASDHAGRVVLFGGYGPGAAAAALFGDTWTWDGRDWTRQHPRTSPEPRMAPLMAYDNDLGKTVLYGGFDPVQHAPYSSTVWTWDGSNWSEQAVDTNPGIFGASAFAFDPISRRFVSFGGFRARVISETWSFDGIKWARLSPPLSPPGRRDAAFEFEPSGEGILFGGTPYMGGSIGDTWSWHAGGWTELHPPLSPSSRVGPAMIYDARSQRLILFGGLIVANSQTKAACDTWAWVD